jgi:hypothetical protein
MKRDLSNLRRLRIARKSSWNAGFGGINDKAASTLLPRHGTQFLLPNRAEMQYTETAAQSKQITSPRRSWYIFRAAYTVERCGLSFPRSDKLALGGQNCLLNYHNCLIITVEFARISSSGQHEFTVDRCEYVSESFLTLTFHNDLHFANHNCHTQHSVFST